MLRTQKLLPAAAFVFVVAACSESLESDVGCPLLCPNQSLDVREVVLDAVDFDATVRRFPQLGTADLFTLANSGDTLESRVVIRFDSLPNTYTVGGVPTPVTGVDSSLLRFFMDTLASVATAPVTVELYDVDTTAVDADFAAINALFRPDRFVSSKTFTVLQLRDTMEVPIPNAVLLGKILSPSRRFRIGMRVVSDSTVKLITVSANQANFPRLRYDPAPNDPAFNVLDGLPRSFSPVDDPGMAVNFTDYQLAGPGPFPLQRNTVGADTIDLFRDSLLVAGGPDGRRIYLRFALPDSILRSAIVRATLILHKRPSSDYGRRDTIPVVPQAVFGTALMPVSKAALLTDTNRVFPMPSNRVEARTGGETRFDIVNWARMWTVESRAEIPHALILRVGQEGRTIQEMHFYSTLAPVAMRPRLRVTFIPRLQIGPP